MFLGIVLLSNTIEIMILVVKPPRSTPELHPACSQACWFKMSYGNISLAALF